jgi:hypothetical protein
VKLRNVFTSLVLLGATLALAQTAPYPPAFLDSRPAGKYFAAQYNYQNVGISTYPGGTGSLTFTTKTSTVDLGDGRKIQPFSINAYVLLDTENLQPSAVSGCTLGSTTPGVCSVTLTTVNSHSTSSTLSSGTYGLDEAIIDAAAGGGGVVVIDPRWQAQTGLTYTAASQLIAAKTVVYPTVIIEDDRLGGTQFWSPIGGTTTMTTPTTLTSTTATDSTTPAGTWASSAYAQGVSCVDIMGQEGPVSATYAHTPAAGSSSVTFVAPTNCLGAIGWIPYSTLAGASYPLAYKLPLVTQPTVLGNSPVALSGSGCTLQTVNPNVIACAITNATYGETASNYVSLAIPVNTSPVAPQTTIISTTSVYVPNPGGKTTYTYAPSLHVSFPGIPSNFQAFPISAAAGTTVPAVLGTVTVPTGFANVVGKTWQLCGKATGVSTATIVSIAFQWDAFGQNTAGKGVIIGNLGLTPATAFATTEAVTFCEVFQTTVASASATGGSIQTLYGVINASGVATAAAGQGAGTDPTGGATGSLNLAGDARINITYTHTTGTDGTAPTLYGLTLSAVN